MKKSESAKQPKAGGFSGSGRPASSAQQAGGLSERDRTAIFALLIIAAAAAGAYALLSSRPSDQPSTLDAFVAGAANSSQLGLFMDARGTDAATARVLYQCGTDLAGGKLFGSHTVETYGCDDTGCLHTSSAANGSDNPTYEQALSSLRSMPYVEVAQGSPKTLFFEHHIEIYLDGSFNGSCRIG